MAKRANSTYARRGTGAGKVAERYTHPGQTSPMRSDVGTQAQFRKKPPKTYRYDSSLSPALSWDGQNGAREPGEWLLALIEHAAALPPPHAFAVPREFRTSDGQVLATVRSLEEAVTQLKRLSGPFLDWAGKAERLSFDVPTLPLFVHERLSTRAIVDTLVGHRKDKKQAEMWDLFGDPRHSITDQVLKAYEHPDRWVNRMILGDSLVVMNSLLQYEGLGGQVQMIYIDPPYGVKFGSNFQPFVRRRDVSHNADEDLTREPEMVKAYRDTWELGLHSYLTYMRDRLLLARDLLAPSGSVFVQISDENLHHVRELMDEVFGAENACTTVLMRKSGWAASALLPQVHDFVLWYAKDREVLKYRQLYLPKRLADMGEVSGAWAEAPNGSTSRPLTPAERQDREKFLWGGGSLFMTTLHRRATHQRVRVPTHLKARNTGPESESERTVIEKHLRQASIGYAMKAASWRWGIRSDRSDTSRISHSRHSRITGTIPPLVDLQIRSSM